jgi:hypothetical protein
MRIPEKIKTDAYPKWLAHQPMENLKIIVECPALFVPVAMKQTGMRLALDGTKKEAYARANYEPASSY